MNSSWLVALCGLCALLAAEAFAPTTLPSGFALRTRASPAVCSMTADGVSRRSVLAGAAAAAVGLAAPIAPLKAFAEEEEEEEEDDEPAPPSKDPGGMFKKTAPKSKAVRKKFQGSASVQGNVKAEEVTEDVSAAGLAIKGVALAAFVGGAGFSAIKFKGKYSDGSAKALDKEAGVPWKIGFTGAAENWNGRLAMLGFVGILLLELVSGKGLVSTGLGLWQDTGIGLIG